MAGDRRLGMVEQDTIYHRVADDDTAAGGECDPREGTKPSRTKGQHPAVAVRCTLVHPLKLPGRSRESEGVEVSQKLQSQY